MPGTSPAVDHGGDAVGIRRMRSSSGDRLSPVSKSNPQPLDLELGFGRTTDLIIPDATADGLLPTVSQHSQRQRTAVMRNALAR